MRRQSETWEEWGKSGKGGLIALGGSNRTASLVAKASAVVAQDISSSEEERPTDARYPPGLVPSDGAKAPFKNPLRNTKTYKAVSESKRRAHERETRQKAQSTMPQTVFVSNSSSDLVGAPVPIKSVGRRALEASQQSTSSVIDVVSAEECGSPEPSSHGPRQFPLDNDEADELNIKPSKRKAEPFPMDIGSNVGHNLPNAPKPFPMCPQEGFPPIRDISYLDRDAPAALCSPPLAASRGNQSSPSTPLPSSLSDMSMSQNCHITPKSQAIHTA